MSAHPPTSIPPFVPPPARRRQSWLTTLGWAAYLACSWTWCIGMFLPVLLVRDFGIWGFVVFAVPNVVGAGTMGWVLRRPGAAERVKECHGLASMCFALVTLLFQLVFGAWMVARRFPDVAPPPSHLNNVLLLAVPIAGLLTIPAMRKRPSLAPAVVLFCISVCAAVLALVAGVFINADPAPLGFRELFQLGSPRGLVWLAPVCAFGFLLCPYLDPTFLRAREQNDPDSGVTAFSLGFGGLFWFMILFTVGYTGWFLRWPMRNFVSVGLCAVIVHILAQGTFTALIHGAEVVRAARSRARTAVWLIAVGFGLGGLAAWISASQGGPLSASVSEVLSPGEVVYRIFMSFYGLVFPAYVWLCMIPVRGEAGTQRPTKSKLAVLAIAVLLAAPCYWMGFIERQTWWLGPGLGIVLVARLFVPRATLAAASALAAGPSAPRSV